MMIAAFISGAIWLMLIVLSARTPGAVFIGKTYMTNRFAAAAIAFALYPLIGVSAWVTGKLGPYRLAIGDFLLAPLKALAGL